MTSPMNNAMIDLMAIATVKMILRVAGQTTGDNGNKPEPAKTLEIIRKYYKCRKADSQGS